LFIIKGTDRQQVKHKAG